MTEGSVTMRGSQAIAELMSRPSTRRSTRPRVVIAGGGVAGLETLLALGAFAPRRLDITLVAPERAFVNRSMAAAQPFEPKRGRGVSLQAIADESGARWHRGAVNRVEHEHRRVVTRHGDVLPYDFLVLALGAHPAHEWDDDSSLTYRDGRSAPDFRFLVHQLQTGTIKTVAFVRQPGMTWPLPLYDLALMTAAACGRRGPGRGRLFMITPEDEPLQVFGPYVATGVRRLLEDRGIELLTGYSGSPGGRGVLELAPGGRRLRVDRIVTVPQLVGPHLRGVPCGADGFIDVDAQGRVPGRDGVFAAGDATSFPIKQGGLAAQQADVVAQVIAASVGADIEPQPFRPVLRAALLTGGAVHFLRADISGNADDGSEVSTEVLWWPPNRLCARFLAPYLGRQVGDALDVLPRDRRARRFVSTPGRPDPIGQRSDELVDLPSR